MRNLHSLVVYEYHYKWYITTIVMTKTKNAFPGQYASYLNFAYHFFREDLYYRIQSWVKRTGGTEL